MAKDPAFLFYPNDWLGGCMGMSFEEKGAYLELLILQFNRGHMTSHMVGQTVGHLWDKVKDKFIQDGNGLWFNERLDFEKEKRKSYSESRRNNLSGTNQYTKKEKKRAHMTSHMENENVNENTDIDEVITYLNQKSGKTFKFIETNRKFIRARMNQGFTLPDFKKVIDIKVIQWKGKEMDKYLRPETLFGTKFESYLNEEAVKIKPTFQTNR